jgi:hypothetical protein
MADEELAPSPDALTDADVPETPEPEAEPEATDEAEEAAAETPETEEAEETPEAELEPEKTPEPEKTEPPKPPPPPAEPTPEQKQARERFDAWSAERQRIETLLADPDKFDPVEDAPKALKVMLDGQKYLENALENALNQLDSQRRAVEVDQSWQKWGKDHPEVGADKGRSILAEEYSRLSAKYPSARPDQLHAAAIDALDNRVALLKAQARKPAAPAAPKKPAPGRIVPAAAKTPPPRKLSAEEKLLRDLGPVTNWKV